MNRSARATTGTSGAILNEVTGILQANYVDRKLFTEEQLRDAAIRGLISSLNDRETSYLTPDELGASGDQFSSTYEGIGATVHYVPAYWHPFYAARGYRRGLCPRAEAAYERLVTLPLFPAMTDADVDDVLTALGKVLRHYAR